MAGQVSRVLAETWRGTEGYVFLPRKSSDGRWVEQGSAHTWDGEHLPRVRLDPTVDQYWCPLVFSEPHRRAEHALPTHVLWSDLDAASPWDCRLRPSIAWQTTQGVLTHDHDTEDRAEADTCPACEQPPHYQALWLLGSYYPSEKTVLAPVLRLLPSSEAAQLSRRIAYAEGADKGGWDVTQVLRLPGTYNHKHDPPQRIELLWAKRLYYTVEQVRAAYPPVPPPAPAATNGWPQMDEKVLLAAISALPVGVQMALERDSEAADRSLELVRLARTLLAFHVPTEVVPLILQRAAINKFAGRADEHQRLLTIIADALLSPQ